MTYTPYGVLSSDARYFVELCLGRVAGCAGLVKEYQNLSKIQHICVLPEFRRKGIAKKLVNLAITACETEFVYMTIREDNVSSRAMAEGLGFKFINKVWFRDHFTLMVARPKIYEGRQYLGTAN